jgi:hypothetical protein
MNAHVKYKVSKLQNVACCRAMSVAAYAHSRTFARHGSNSWCAAKASTAQAVHRYADVDASATPIAHEQC